MSAAAPAFWNMLDEVNGSRHVGKSATVAVPAVDHRGLSEGDKAKLRARLAEGVGAAVQAEPANEPELPQVAQDVSHARMVAGLLAASDPARFGLVVPQGRPTRAEIKDDIVNLESVVAPDPWLQDATALQAMEALPGFTPGQWLNVQAGCLALAQTWGERMRELGWSVLDGFGIDADAPGGVHAWGLGLLVGNGQVVELTERTASIVTVTGARQTFRRRSRPWGQPVWEVAAEAAGTMSKDSALGVSQEAVWRSGT